MPEEPGTISTQESESQETEETRLERSTIANFAIRGIDQLDKLGNKIGKSIARWANEIRLGARKRFQGDEDGPSGTQVNVNRLGFYLDGWADLIEGMGSKTTEVKGRLLQQLIDRNMPDILVHSVKGYVRFFSSESRGYALTVTHPGASTTIYVGEHGKDLYVSWRTFISRIWNWRNLIIALLIAIITSLSVDETFRIFRNFIEQVGFIIIALIIIFILMWLIGRFFKQDGLSLFFIEPTLFDAEDITGMSLSAHKSLLRALDSVGIESSKLRIKRDFKGGRRDVTL